MIYYYGGGGVVRDRTVAKDWFTRRLTTAIRAQVALRNFSPS